VEHAEALELDEALVANLEKLVNEDLDSTAKHAGSFEAAENEERHRAIGVELRKLLEAGFIKEVFHPTWLANLVLVKKKNGKWRMCVDYTSLNKACPKVPFPLPRTDQIVDSTVGCELLCFLDAYSGYHQRKMKESDQLVTSFITPFGMYCYVMMPFGLRNAGATYQ
jgi:hypothetical protein